MTVNRSGIATDGKPLSIGKNLLNLDMETDFYEWEPRFIEQESYE